MYPELDRYSLLTSRAQYCLSLSEERFCDYKKQNEI